MFNTIKQDYLASRTPKPYNIFRMLYRGLQDAGFRAVVLYRGAREKKIPLLPALVERLMRHLCFVWISTLAELGPGFRIAHVCGIVIPPGVIFGKNCEIRQNTTLGGNYGKRSDDGRTTPKVGDHVSIGPGASILGPIELGSNSIVGANAVVTKSVPPHSVVSGFRAEVIAQRDEKGSIVRDEQKMFLSRHELYERIVALETAVKQLQENGAAHHDA